MRTASDPLPAPMIVDFEVPELATPRRWMLFGTSTDSEKLAVGKRTVAPAGAEAIASPIEQKVPVPTTVTWGPGQEGRGGSMLPVSGRIVEPSGVLRVGSPE